MNRGHNSQAILADSHTRFESFCNQWG
ncbi:BnaA09g52550D [Brassica napus]|uniref:BnaA09g52550D protein n=1 Tax=Brassica napus TaxID=3708 RepID=A0A078J1T9_BRANA|nr:BnaA09g52550D [Brassica napus]